MKIEEALHTIKGNNETWKDVFTRLDSAGCIDIKTLTNVIICILEELDEKKGYTPSFTTGDPEVPNFTVTSGSTSGPTKKNR